MRKMKLKEKIMSKTMYEEKCMSNIVRKRGIVTTQQNAAITLIALIITIIVLLILAGVTLNMVMGDSGIFGKANKAGEETNKSQALEEIRLKVLEVQAEKDGKATLNDVVEALSEDLQNLYKVYLETGKLQGNPPTITEETEKIYVDYKNYKFQIDNKLIVTFVGDEEEDNEKEFSSEEIDIITDYNYEVKETIPVMNSNESNYGNAFASDYYNNKYSAYCAFNNSLSSAWNSNGEEGIHYLGFCYRMPMVIKKIELQFPVNLGNKNLYPKWCLPSDMQLMASNDGINYIKITDFHIEDKYTNEKLSFPVNNENEYLYYKIQYNQENSLNNGGDDILIGYLQFFGYEKYYEAIENLTNETGINVNVSASSVWMPHSPYKAFDGKLNTGWNASEDSINEQYIECNFNKALKAKGFLIQKSTNNNSIDIPNKIYLKASNDGVNYKLLGTYNINDEMKNNRLYYELDNNNYYKYYRIEYNQEIAQKDGGPDIMFGLIQLFK